MQGGAVAYAKLDLAASAPALRAVAAADSEFLPWYSSVHRGDAVVFTRNTTEATNLLAWTLPDDAEVVTFATEHHANLLPWRRRRVTVLPPPTSPAAAVEQLADALRQRSRSRTALVAVTGASNVVGAIASASSPSPSGACRRGCSPPR